MKEALQALDRLNSWARSGSCRRCFSSPVKAIYAMKREAIRRAHEAGLIDRLRRVATDVKCSHCGGTGRYVHWSGDEFDHCWQCRSTGVAHLVFIETIIDGIRWHTPLDRFPLAHSETPACEEPTGGWSPNTPGRDMTPAEAARDLILAEREFYPLLYYRSLADHEDFQYRLYLGEADRSKCSFCGSEPTAGGYHVARGRIEWSDYACKDCDSKFPRSTYYDRPNPPSIFDSFPEPAHLLEHPDIQRWIELHPARKKEAA